MLKSLTNASDNRQIFYEIYKKWLGFKFDIFINKIGLNFEKTVELEWSSSEN